MRGSCGKGAEYDVMGNIQRQGKQMAVTGSGRLPVWLYLALKRCFDFVFSLVCLIILSPVLLIIAIAVHGMDRGPIIYRRRCVSANGSYDMLKFRTMVIDSDDLYKYMSQEQIVEYRANIKLKNDPRVTKLGRFLRRTSMDELPQLFNILRGEMSFVGPRPVVQEELRYFGEKSALLLSAKPGITGYWQVCGRSDCTYESGERQRMELYYVEHRCLSLDVRILLRTIPAVLSARGTY